MDRRIASGPLSLAAHLAMPENGADPTAAVVICHGFPSDLGGGANSVRTYPDLAEQIAAAEHCAVLTFTYRGCGDSDGDFSLQGWLDDLRAAVAYVREQTSVSSVVLVGFGTGGSLALCAAAGDPAIRAVATMASPDDFADWASAPHELLEHAVACEVISTEGFPEDFEAWSAELSEIRPKAALEDLDDRPLLVIHGSEDDLVPHFDARALHDAHAHSELRIIEGAGHHLRHDPRAIAVLGGWLAAQLSDSPSRPMRPGVADPG